MAGAGASTGDRLQFIREGIHHIVTGYDHVLFLLALLLPSVMRRTPQGWQPVQNGSGRLSGRSSVSSLHSRSRIRSR